MVATLSVVGVSALVVGVAGGGMAVAKPTGAVNCTPYMAYLVPGTGETSADADPTKPVGLLSSVGEALSEEFGEQISTVYVPYEASAFDKGKTYRQSQATGVAAAAELIGACPDSEIVLAGYSQGADVAGDIAWHIGHNDAPIAASKVRGVALLADPKSGTRALVGTKRTGEGISGDRPGGFGQLDSRVKSICAPDDMYCNVRSDNPMAKVLGKLLGSGGGERDSVTPIGDAAPAVIEDAGLAELVTDFSGVDLVGAKSKATDLKTRTETLAQSDTPPTVAQLEEIVSLATSLNETYAGVDDVNSFAEATGARSILDADKKGTPGAKTAEVLDAVGESDMESLLGDSEQIIATGTDLISQLGAVGETANSGTEADTLLAGGELLQTLALQGAGIAQNSGMLSELDRSNLTAATGVLSTLKLSSVVDTSMMAMSVNMSTDFEGINANLAKMGELIMAGDHVAVHDVSQELLDQLEPWVEFMDTANSKLTPMAASMVTVAPDPSGTSAMTGLAMQVFSQLDVKAVWNTARKAHDISGRVGEGHPEAYNEVPMLLMDLANIAVGALTGTDTGLGELRSGAGTGTSGVAPATPGNGGTSGAPGKGADSTDLSTLAQQAGFTVPEGVDLDVNEVGGMSDIVQDLGGSKELSTLMDDGLDFVAFLGSGAHTSDYTNRTLVGNMSAVDYMGAYFIKQLGGGGEDPQEASDTGSKAKSERGADSAPRSERSGSSSGSDRGAESKSGSKSERPRASARGDEGTKKRAEHTKHRNGGISPAVMEAVAPLVNNAGATRVSVSMADVSGGEMQTIGGSPDTYAASTVKVAVAAAAVDKIGADKLTETMIPVTEITGGANAVTATGEYKASDLLGWMITESCNTSTNAVIDYLGGFAPVNEIIAAAGVDEGYSLQNKMMTTQDSVLSSEGGTQFLQSLYRASAGQGRWIDSSAAGVVIDLMAQQKNRTKLGRDLPKEVVYNKTGENSGVSHDMGYILAGDRVYAVTVTTTGQTDDELIGKIGKTIQTTMG